MIKSIHFQNFKALRDATLPLSRFTLIVGPNGSGKSTAMQGLSLFSNPEKTSFTKLVTADLQRDNDVTIAVTITWALDNRSIKSVRRKSKASSRFVESLPSELSVKVKSEWPPIGSPDTPVRIDKHIVLPPDLEREIFESLANFKIFSFDPQALIEPVMMRPSIKLREDGRNLAGVLENLRDSDYERFEELNNELGRWLPEFDRIQFETPTDGHKAFELRTRVGRHRIKAIDLSHGTLFALAFLTIAYLPNPPSILCFEEPEKGLHPRLFREIRDGMYRLCYPETFGDKRDPVQVIATTHSPYLLDLYKDHPEEIVIAQKDEQGVHFERLSDKPNFDEFLQDAPLGEVWYSGVLGGVPAKP